MSNEKLGAEQGRETLQAIAQEIVANLGSCDASSDLGFKVIWATLDRHFGTGPKQAEQAEQAYHARGAGALIAPIEALIEYHEKYAKSHVSSKWIYGENMMVVQAYKKVLQMIEAQSEPGADTGTTPPPDVWTCEACGYKSDDIGEYREVCGKCFSAAAERGTTPPEGLRELEDALDARDVLSSLLTSFLVRLNCADKVRDLTEAEYEIREKVRDALNDAATQRAPVSRFAVQVEIGPDGEPHKVQRAPVEQGRESDVLRSDIKTILAPWVLGMKKPSFQKWCAAVDKYFPDPDACQGECGFEHPMGDQRHLALPNPCSVCGVVGGHADDCYASETTKLMDNVDGQAPDHAREGALPTVDEIAEAMADARLWAGAWEQMCEAERNVMRQGAEGVYKLLEARR